MKNLLIILIVLSQIFILSHKTLAQKSINQSIESTQNKKDFSEIQNSTGLKKQGASGVIQTHSGSRNDSVTFINKTNEFVNTPLINPVSNFETSSFDYNQMPDDVQLKMNANKEAGIPVLTGVEKCFSVEIKTCRNVADAEKTFSFLKTENGFIRTEFVSDGLVRIIVAPSFDSVTLKEQMLERGQSFNFLNEFYFINK